MKRVRSMISWIAVFGGAVVAGCSANQYEIEMKPAGNAIERHITCWNVENADESTQVGAFSASELERIAVAYGAAVPKKLSQKHKFVASFVGQLPHDLGGAGSYTHWDTPLGSVSGYVERLRGNDDLLTNVEDRLKAVDRVANLLTGWLKSELSSEPIWAPLQEFMEKEFRRDLKNLSLYFLTCSLAAEHNEIVQPECLVRAGQYLVERGYLTPAQLPVWTRAIQDNEETRPDRLLALIQRLIATRIGVSAQQPIPASLGFLADPEHFQESMNSYLRQTPDYRKVLTSWNRDNAKAPGAKKPEPSGLMVDLVLQAFIPGFDIGPADQVNVVLAAAHRPFATNGHWDAEQNQVSWSHSMRAADSKSPTVPKLLFAIWSEPNRQVQRVHFGKIVLQDDTLGAYCLWYRGLTQAEAKEWDTFVASLRPGSDLVSRLGSFQFSSDELASKEGRNSGLASHARDLILPSLPGEDASD